MFIYFIGSYLSILLFLLMIVNLSKFQEYFDTLLDILSIECDIDISKKYLTTIFIFLLIILSYIGIISLILMFADYFTFK